VHLVGIAQSLGLFFVVCLAMTALLSLAMAGLSRMERAAVPVPVRRPVRRPGEAGAVARISVTDRVSSPGGCTYGPRGQ
jgi:hypothetical protein